MRYIEVEAAKSKATANSHITYGTFLRHSDGFTKDCCEHEFEQCHCTNGRWQAPFVKHAASDIYVAVQLLPPLSSWHRLRAQHPNASRRYCPLATRDRPRPRARIAGEDCSHPRGGRWPPGNSHAGSRARQTSLQESRRRACCTSRNTATRLHPSLAVLRGPSRRVQEPLTLSGSEMQAFVEHVPARRGR